MEIWGIFGIAHIVSWPIAAGIIIALYFIIKNRSEKTKITVLTILSLSGISAIIFNLVTWGSPLEYLPLHLCSINAILLPIALITRNKAVGNMLVVWCLGALAAVLMNFYPESVSDLYGPTFLFFYLPHVFEFGIPVIAFKLGIIKLDYKTIPTTLGITAAIYTAIHFINLGLVDYVVSHDLRDYAGEYIHINYMYSLKTEGFALLNVFWNILPHSYWYMYLVFPIITVYLGIVYLPQILKEKRKKNAVSE